MNIPNDLGAGPYDLGAGCLNFYNHRNVTDFFYCVRDRIKKKIAKFKGEVW